MNTPSIFSFGLLLLVTLLPSCTTTAYLDPALESSAAVMPVEGKNRWFQQRLRFGPYQSDPVLRGWARKIIEEKWFWVRGQDIRDKFRFRLDDGQGRTSEVWMTGMVDLINKGRVAISTELDPEMQFLLANASAALLLRQDLLDKLD